MEIVLIAIIAAIIIFILNGRRLSSEKERFRKSVEENIDRRSIKQSIIKRTNAEFFESIWRTNPQGLLILTWDNLHWFGQNGQTIEIPIRSVRSTTYEHQFNRSILVLFGDFGTQKFSWADNVHPATGVGIASGGQGGFGFASTTSANPIVQEWMAIIDDLRFGRLTKPVQ